MRPQLMRSLKLPLFVLRTVQRMSKATSSRHFRNTLFALTPLTLAVGVPVGAAPGGTHLYDAPQPQIEVIDAGVRCSTCALDTVRVATLRPPDSASPIGMRSSVVRDSAGQYLVPAYGGKSILVFDRQGRFLREVGRAGEGPGEFRNVTALAVLPGGGVLVFDQVRRIHVFTRDLVFLETIRPPAALQQPHILWDGSILGRLNLGTDPRGGYPGYILRLGDSAFRPVGKRQDLALNARCRGCEESRVHPSTANGNVWISAANRFLLEQASLANGTVRRTISVMRSDWFIPWDTAGYWSSGAAPRPSSITEVREGRDGLLWVAGAMTLPGWTATPPTGVPGVVQFGDGSTAIPLPGPAVDAWQRDVHSKFGAVVHVLNPSARASIGVISFSGAVRFLEAGQVYRIRETPQFDLAIDVLEIVVRR